MRRGRGNAPRCEACRLHLEDCVCGLLPTIATRTRLILVLHQLEARKPTNSGRLAMRCLPNSQIVVRGRDDSAEAPADAGGRGDLTQAAGPGLAGAYDQAAAAAEASAAAAHGGISGDAGSTEDATSAPPWLSEAVRPVLLFPHPEARPVEHWRDGRPLSLIVPDGTWSQAIRARRRIPGLDQIPCAVISGAAPSEYRLRHDPRPGRLSTLEAIARALGILEGPASERALLAAQRVWVERTLRARGQGEAKSSAIG